MRCSALQLVCELLLACFTNWSLLDLNLFLAGKHGFEFFDFQCYDCHKVVFLDASQLIRTILFRHRRQSFELLFQSAF